MELTTFQQPELRDSSNNIVQEGAYGKNSAFCNAQNTGILDYVNNNLQALYNDKADKTTTLNLSGGTMTGTITTTNNTALIKNNTDGYLEIRGGTDYLNGAYLNLVGQNCTSKDAGSFSICARISSGGNTLVGKPDGTLLWGGNNVIASTTKSQYIKRNVDDDFLVIRGGTAYDKGGTVVAYGKDYSGNLAGTIRLIAHNGTNSSILSLFPNGSLNIDDKAIAVGKRVNMQVSSGATVTINYSGYNMCVLHYARGSICGVIAFDNWNGVSQIITSSSSAPTVSCSSRIISFKNNSSSVALSVAVDMY